MEIQKDRQARQDLADRTSEWTFPEPREAQAYLSKAVLEHREPITFVCHEKQAWQFLGDSMAESGAVSVCLHHPIDEDPSLAELAALPLNWCAERKAPGAVWTRSEIDDGPGPAQAR